MLLIFSHIFSIVRAISHCRPIQHCNWPLCFIMLCMCCEIYAVWCVCLISHNGAYVRSLSRGATCHEGPLFLWTSGGRPWQVLLYMNQRRLTLWEGAPSNNFFFTRGCTWMTPNVNANYKVSISFTFFVLTIFGFPFPIFHAASRGKSAMTC